MTALLLASVLMAPAADTVVIVLDDSGSMNDRMGDGSRMDAAKRAILTVMERTPEDTRVGVLLLNGDPAWVVPPDAGEDRVAAVRAVQQLRARGGTALGAAMKTAADRLLGMREEAPAGQYRMLIVSDGEANDDDLVDAYLPQIQARGLTVDVIGVDMEDDLSLATQVATYRRADDAAALEEAISSLVLAETVPDDGDAGQSDFEMLEGLPDRVAAAALTAMTQPVNTPIKEPEPTGWFGSGGNAAGGGAAGGGGFSFFKLLAVMAAVWFVLSALRGQRRASR